MLGLDHYAPYLLWAFGVTVVVLGGYMVYLRSRLAGARRRAALRQTGPTASYSGRNVTAAAPMVTTAQPASSANGPSTP
jgi:hypothetical protein